jgi:hypothetical protein
MAPTRGRGFRPRRSSNAKNTNSLRSPRWLPKPPGRETMPEEPAKLVATRAARFPQPDDGDNLDCGLLYRAIEAVFRGVGRAFAIVGPSPCGWAGKNRRGLAHDLFVKRRTSWQYTFERALSELNLNCLAPAWRHTCTPENSASSCSFLFLAPCRLQYRRREILTRESSSTVCQSHLSPLLLSERAPP